MVKQIAEVESLVSIFTQGKNRLKVFCFPKQASAYNYLAKLLFYEGPLSLFCVNSYKEICK